MRLRHLLAAAFTVVATVPVIFLGAWVYKSSMETELAMVHEKHLLLAGNATAALERYAKDTEAAFELFVDLTDKGRSAAEVTDLAVQLGFRHFAVRDAAGRSRTLVAFQPDEAGPLPDELWRDIGDPPADSVVFSPVVTDARGNAVIYLLRRIDPARIAVAALDTAYIVKLQQAITFGRKGHAAIVDHRGNLIAHPNPQWTLEHRNIAKVEPVRRMMLGETGVAQFFSPAMKQDMISGFTTADGPGWGVMVPQPIVELEERARTLAFAALAIGLVGLAAAAAIGWMVAGSLTRPVRAVLVAAREIAAGRLAARVAPPPALLPVEFADLGREFNGMAETLQQDQVELQDALGAARQADTAKSMFLAAMSHELRTPLNSIIGFTDVIRSQSHRQDPEARTLEYLDDIHQAGIHLLALINDILDFSRIEAGQLEIHDDPIDGTDVIKAALAAVEELRGESGVELRCELDSDLPPLRGSEAKLRQALVNLLSNAIHFTPDGGLVTVSARNDAGAGLAICISDTGIGMTEAEIAIALTPFRQVDASLSRQHQGTGLGLPLAKRLVELHGGSLEIESLPGEGTWVQVRLPGDRDLAEAA